MTIFYGGAVNIYNDVPLHKVSPEVRISEKPLLSLRVIRKPPLNFKISLKKPLTALTTIFHVGGLDNVEECFFLVKIAIHTFFGF